MSTRGVGRDQITNKGVGRQQVQETYRPKGAGRKSIFEKRFNPLTGMWENVASISDSTPLVLDSPPSNTSSIVSSVTALAEKEYKTIEYSTLEGILSLVPTANTLKISVGDTINLQGVGKFLSGRYYVSERKIAVTKDEGLILELTVIKTGFGDSLKKPEVDTTATRPQEVKSKIEPQFKVGDKVKIVGDNAVYSNADDGKKIPNWVKNKTHTIDKVSDDQTRVRLKEVFSWTYTKFIQKV